MSGNLNPHDVAVVIGGAEAVDQEAMQTSALFAGTECQPVYFVINDKIPLFANADHAVTLHPVKMAGWLKARAEAGLPPVENVWSFWEYPGINRLSRLPHWQGSSGLYAVKIARELGFEKIILCGVPMDIEAKHFLRKSRWRVNMRWMRQSWRNHRTELAPYVRSWSGWTKTLFGPPDAVWLNVDFAVVK